MRRQYQSRVWMALALAAGLALRAWFVAHHAEFAGDALVYGDIAKNLLTRHVYGMSTPALHPTLVRLPGYPLFLAGCFRVFGMEHYGAVLWVQVVLDLLSCWLLGAMAGRRWGPRVGMAVLWIAALCPFTANYAAAALTETASIFCVVLAMWGLERWCGAGCGGADGIASHPSRKGRATDGAPDGLAGPPIAPKARAMSAAPKVGAGSAWGWGIVIGIALSWAVLLRPEQGLLAVAVVPAMCWVVWTARGKGLRRWMPVVVVCGMVAAPLTVWVLRNWRVFHVVQPLAPRSAMDPGEQAPVGFERWFRTWGIDFVSTMDVYWNYDGAQISMHDVPPRAFDSDAQRTETAALLAAYNKSPNASPEWNAAFGKIADERVRAHPLAYWVGLPVAREADMWLRPRTELMDAPLEWWDVRGHPGASAWEIAYGALDVALLAAACAGLWWRRREFFGAGAVSWAMVAFVALRCALLLTMDNSEPRYTLECFPVVFVLAGLWFATRRGMPAPRKKV